MGLDPALVAAATLTRQALGSGQASPDDGTFQLQLAHVLLDGGYDGVATIAEALAGGDHGLGTLDALNGELVVVDGDPWQVDFHGDARIVPPEATTPFMVVGHLHQPRTLRLRDLTLDEVGRAVESLVSDAGAVVAVRLEGTFHHALLRSVPPQTPPYRPIAEVCETDEVRWDRRPFEGVFIGFRFPDLSGTDTIPGLHLHALSADHSTGGHSHDVTVADAVLSVGLSHEVVISLPDRGMVDLLETPAQVRAVQRLLLRRGPRTTDQVAADLGVPVSDAAGRLSWLVDRGYAEEWQSGLEHAPGATRWKARLAPSSSKRGSWRASDLLADM